MYELRQYETPGGHLPVQEWLESLRDGRVNAAILRRFDRMAAGNFGDHAYCRDGVWELRIDLGPGYRVYYSKADKKIILLLQGGDKRKQQADIDRAVRYLQEIQRGQ